MLPYGYHILCLKGVVKQSVLDTYHRQSDCGRWRSLTTSGEPNNAPHSAKNGGLSPAARVSMDARVIPDQVRDRRSAMTDQLSRKLRSFLDRDGCFSFRSAFA